jgi:hypothetical protein
LRIEAPVNLVCFCAIQVVLIFHSNASHCQRGSSERNSDGS